MPGFPVTDDLLTNSVTISDTHLTSSRTVQTFRASFFRNVFLNGQAVNHTPGSSLGFNYQPTLGLNQGVPYLIVSGYASLGNPITGPQNTYQNNYQGSYSIAMTRGAKYQAGRGAGKTADQRPVRHRHQRIFVFAPFPASDSFASFLLGQSVQFFQGAASSIADFANGFRPATLRMSGMFCRTSP